MVDALVVEDDPGYGPYLLRVIQRLNHSGRLVQNGEEAIRVALDQTPRIILIDWCLPDHNGPKLVQMLRILGSRAGIALMSAIRNDPQDEATALQAGANIFLAKDEGRKPLERHIQALAALSCSSSVEPVYEIEDLEFFPKRTSLRIAGVLVSLNPQETLLLEFFFKRPEAIHSREQIWHTVWGRDCVPGWRHALDNRIFSLRAKLGPKWSTRLVCYKKQGFLFSLTQPSSL